MNLEILITKPQEDYELIDSGAGEKLERYGSMILRRPDPQALWPKRLSLKEWSEAHYQFVRLEGRQGGNWKVRQGSKEEWQIAMGGLKFWIKPTAFKHTGIFPEQLPNWQWMQGAISKALAAGREEVSFLNLFGYTGGASLAAAAAGAKVTHVDASKSAITWARDNAEISDLKDKPIRWILDDALAFAKKEAKRGRKYDCIIMDPPAFGRGAKGEVWKIEEGFGDLLKYCFELLSDKPLFLIVNGYAAGYSAIAYANNLGDLVSKYGGIVKSGELAIEESAGRLLPAGIWSRWNS